MYPFKSSGRIVAGSSLESFTKARPWWMILQCDPGIMEYYRWWIHNHQRDVWGRQVYKTCPPLARSHISIVRGEAPKDQKVWNELIGRRFEFKYNNKLETNGKHWWVYVDAPELLEVRRNLGLRPPKYQFHLTVATNAENCLV